MDFDDLLDMSGKHKNKHHGYSNDHDDTMYCKDHTSDLSNYNRSQSNFHRVKTTHNHDSHDKSINAMKTIARNLMKNKLLLAIVLVLVCITAIAGLGIVYFVLTTGTHLFPKLAAMVTSLDITGIVALILERLLGTGK